MYYRFGLWIGLNCSYIFFIFFYRFKIKVKIVVIFFFYFYFCVIEKYLSELFMFLCYYNYIYICLLLNLYCIYNMYIYIDLFVKFVVL